jgi:MEDS: MEthanogen/methylotroph, DcmR Sensory domain
MTGPQSLTIMNRSVLSSTHICAFYSGPAGRDDVVMPFLADGIRAGRKCICVLESLGPPDVPARLDRQVDMGHSVETWQLELATLDDVVPSFPAGIFCLNDLQRFGAEVLMDTLRTHPMAVVDSMVHDNPYYIDPGEFLHGPD